jgi:hypothetical protein
MDHGKFQLALAQVLMERPLPKDFGMLSTWCTSDSVGGWEVSRHTGSSRSLRNLPTVDRLVTDDEFPDIILSQESVNTGVQPIADNVEGDEAPIPKVNEAERIVEGHPGGPAPRPVLDVAVPGRRRRRPN